MICLFPCMISNMKYLYSRSYFALACVFVFVAHPVVSPGPPAGSREAPLLAGSLLLPEKTQSPRRCAAFVPDTHGGGEQVGAAARLRLCPACIHRQVGVLDI